MTHWTLILISSKFFHVELWFWTEYLWFSFSENVSYSNEMTVMQYSVMGHFLYRPTVDDSKQSNNEYLQLCSQSSRNHLYKSVFQVDSLESFVEYLFHVDYFLKVSACLDELIMLCQML